MRSCPVSTGIGHFNRSCSWTGEEAFENEELAVIMRFHGIGKLLEEFDHGGVARRRISRDL